MGVRPPPLWPLRGGRYGIGINPYQASYLARVTGLGVTDATMVTLRRLARVEPADPGLPLTAFLARCHRLLKADGIRYVVSFSDPEQGHNGGIYRAANFIHLGMTQAEWHTVDAAGVRVHRRKAYRHSKRLGCSIAEARVRLGLVRVQTAPRDRWFLPLHAKDRRIALDPDLQAPLLTDQDAAGA